MAKRVDAIDIAIDVAGATAHRVFDYFFRRDDAVYWEVGDHVYFRDEDTNEVHHGIISDIVQELNPICQSCPVHEDCPSCENFVEPQIVAIVLQDNCPLIDGEESEAIEAAETDNADTDESDEVYSYQLTLSECFDNAEDVA